MCDNSHLFGGASSGASWFIDGILCIKNNILRGRFGGYTAHHFNNLHATIFTLTLVLRRGYALRISNLPNEVMRRASHYLRSSVIPSEGLQREIGRYTAHHPIGARSVRRAQSEMLNKRIKIAIAVQQ